MGETHQSQLQFQLQFCQLGVVRRNPLKCAEVQCKALSCTNAHGVDRMRPSADSYGRLTRPVA